MGIAGLVTSLGGAVVHADSATESAALTEVRAAAEGAQFPKALTAIDAAIASGGLAPTELYECYRLQGEALVALGKAAAAREAFTKLLILNPEAELGEFVSPKISGELTTARQNLDGLSLRAEATVDAKAARVSLQLVADPQSMAKHAELAYAGSEGQIARVRSELASGKAVFDLPGASNTVEVSLLDSHGNRLATYSVSYQPPPSAVVGEVAAPRTQAEPPPLWSRWWVWAAGGATMAVVGVRFGVASQNAQSDLDLVLETPQDHFFSEAEALEDTARQRARWANVSFAGACGLAAASAYFYWRESSGKSERQPVLVPTTDGAGTSSIQLRGTF
ncbi:MAG: hypothetical protein GY811_13715 [Myxococcales bacterium]|nr:hypothetical protein [Myxococcales bacterium]